MIPQAYITEWRNKAPWQSNEQVEQDLVISRALLELFSDEWLADRLAFRGGTALHKLYLQPQARYSEDIDLVQVAAEPFGPVVDRIRDRLSFLGEPKRSPKPHNFMLYFRFQSEFPPAVNLRLKVETNTREHFNVLGLQQYPYEVQSSWFNGACNLITYQAEELLATKLRALYQRKKGRDLFDLYYALVNVPNLNVDSIIHCYKAYMNNSMVNPPSQREFIENLEAKIGDPEFTGDTLALLRPGIKYEIKEGFQLIAEQLISRL